MFKSPTLLHYSVILPSCDTTNNNKCRNNKYFKRWNSAGPGYITSTLALQINYLLRLKQLLIHLCHHVQLQKTSNFLFPEDFEVIRVFPVLPPYLLARVVHQGVTQSYSSKPVGHRVRREETTAQELAGSDWVGCEGGGGVRKNLAYLGVYIISVERSTNL